MKKNTISRLCPHMHSGGTPSTKNREYWDSGNIPWLTSSESGNDYINCASTYITQAGVDNSATKLAKKGSIIIATAGEGKTRAQVSFLNIDAYINQSLITMKADEKELLTHYLYYYLKNSYQRLRSLSDITGVRGSLSGELLGSFEISYPDIKTQKQVVEILSAIDEKIAINEDSIIKLNELTKTIYDYWFLQFEFPNDEGKPYKSSGGKMVWNEELKREIPESWEVSKFDDIVDSAPSIQSIKAPDYKKIGKYPIIDQAEEYISGRTDDEYCVFKNSNNCVVFGDVTKYFKYVNFSFAKGTDGTKIVQSKNNRIPALLLYHLIKDIKLPNIGFARHYMYLREIKFIVPPLDICQKFTDIAEPLMNLKKHSHDEIYELINLRDFLLPLLMNGQVTFKGSKI